MVEQRKQALRDVMAAFGLDAEAARAAAEAVPDAAGAAVAANDTSTEDDEAARPIAGPSRARARPAHSSTEDSDLPEPYVGGATTPARKAAAARRAIQSSDDDEATGPVAGPSRRAAKRRAIVASDDSDFDLPAAP